VPGHPAVAIDKLPQSSFFVVWPLLFVHRFRLRDACRTLPTIKPVFEMDGLGICGIVGGYGWERLAEQ
ncbi:hypothetical protein M413DRAFT_448114, partial [Hebeloma cylindrosporum]